jgi:glutathione synthase/RimK-type ligase-like ATP-grasp enzyme
MVLIFGIPSESPVALLAKACKRKKIPYYIFNQRNQENWTVAVDRFDYNNSSIADEKRHFKLTDCSGIYLRPMDHKVVPEYRQSEDKQRIDNMYINFFSLMDNATKPLITNPPAPQMSNNSKPYQAMAIKKMGLNIPETCITSDPAEAEDFINKHNQVIYKSISGYRSIVRKVDKNDLKRLNKIQYCPVQFQECVTGTNIRVHVIGNTAIATKRISDAVDYRYAGMESKRADLSAYKLPADIAEKCVRLAHYLKLPFSGVDLMMTNDGRTICFEVNPSPGYSYYELNTGQPISGYLAAYLHQNSSLT